MQRDDGSLNAGAACMGGVVRTVYARAGHMLAMNAGRMRPNFGDHACMSTSVVKAAPPQNTATANTKRLALQAAMGGVGR